LVFHDETLTALVRLPKPPFRLSASLRAMSGSDAARLLNLEEKIAYQDKAIAELNDVVVALNRQVSDQKARLEQLERLLGGELSHREMPNEKPPHY
jgi:uncharacterized coiled-coil protein SlyX